VTGISLSDCGWGAGTEESPGLNTNAAVKTSSAPAMKNAFRVMKSDRSIYGFGQELICDGVKMVTDLRAVKKALGRREKPMSAP
jgi:hypothetical protein